MGAITERGEKVDQKPLLTGSKKSYNYLYKRGHAGQKYCNTFVAFAAKHLAAGWARSTIIIS